MLRLRFVAAFIGLVGFAQPAAPRFEEYPAAGKYNGKNAAVVLAGKDDREYRTQLRDAARKQPDFAGHYVVAQWGCGGGCVMGAAIDLNTGTVAWFPGTICCWAETDDKFEPVRYKLTSRLIVFSGERNEKDGDDGQHYYELKDGKFVHVLSVLKGKK
jgi:hypothetical protein